MLLCMQAVQKQYWQRSKVREKEVIERAKPKAKDRCSVGSVTEIIDEVNVLNSQKNRGLKVKVEIRMVRKAIPVKMGSSMGIMVAINQANQVGSTALEPIKAPRMDKHGVKMVMQI